MFDFPAPRLDERAHALRAQLRAFLRAERESGGFVPQADCWVSGVDFDFSRKLGARGWLGMVWPRAYGGAEARAIERYIVVEELLAAGAPVAAHWIADRQTGHQILRHGTEQQKRTILPRMARGECYSAIGMSEPQAGSDLAAIRTSARREGEGWVLSGRKIWSTGAHFAHYMIVLARTAPPQGRDRRVGLSQFLVDLKTLGIAITPIEDLGGAPHFNEVLFDEVRLDADALLGTEGEGWAQCMGELALERSGPERFLSSFAVIEAALPMLAASKDVRVWDEIGRIHAHLRALRRMSLGIAQMLEDGTQSSAAASGQASDEAGVDARVAVCAALVKEMGNRIEREIVEILRALVARIAPEDWPSGFEAMLRAAVLRLPSNSLRGGTSEILRGIVARELGMR